MMETHLRNNYIDWIPLKNGEEMLLLSENMDNLEGMWDYIIVSDAFARVPSYLDGKTPYKEFFRRLKEHLKPSGHVILAVDNRFGLKYFAGNKEHLTGKYFEGLEGYRHSEGVRTFSKAAILSMVREAGFEEVKTYYPYPDHRYMTAMYSDSHLPSVGELNKNKTNFGEERVLLFDESAVFDELIREGRFQEFSNSYLFDLRLKHSKAEEELLYVKYSVERGERYRIRTEIVRKADGTKVVRKVPYGEAAAEHVKNMKHWETVLRREYEPAGVLVNRCALTEQGAEFEFIKGETLEERMDQCLEKNDLNGLIEEMKAYTKKLEMLLKPEPFHAGEAFREIFGDIAFTTPQRGAKINDMDLIFSNILIKDEKWNIIDYEWTFDFQIPIKFLIYRALKLYCEQRKEISLQRNRIYSALGITNGEEEVFSEMEHRLQLYLLGGTKTMDALAYEYAGKVMDLKEILHRGHASEMKVYLDFGEGFSETDSYVVEAEEDFYGRRRLTLSLPQGITGLRIDPCEEPCMVTVNRILGECGGSYEVSLSHNGRAYEKSILYTTKDPQILITEIVPGTSQLHVDLTVDFIKEETGYVWMKLLMRAQKCDRMEGSFIYRLLKKIKNFVKK